MKSESPNLPLAREIESLDTILLRIENRISLLASAIPVDEEGLVSDARQAMQTVTAFRDHLNALAERVKVDPPRWTTREQLLAEVGRVETAVEALGLTDRRVVRLRAAASLLEAGTLRHRSEKVRRMIEELRRDACAELLGFAEAGGGPELPGPDTNAEWIVWSKDNSSVLESVGFPVVAEFLRAAPEEFFEADPNAPGVAEKARRRNSAASGSSAETKDDETGPAGIDTLSVEEAPADTQSADRPESGASGSVTATSPAPSQGDLRTESSPPSPQRPPIKPVSVDVRHSARSSIKLADEIPEELRSFDSFQKRRWVSPTGVCEEAPWNDPTFRERLCNGFVSALAAEPPRLGDAWVIAKAGEELDCAGLPSAAELGLFTRAWIDPAGGVAALDYRPRFDLAAAVTNDKLGDDVASRLRVFAEALRPQRENRIDVYLVEALLGAVPFHNGLIRRVIEAMLRIGLANGEPVPTIRDAFAGAGRAAETAQSLEKSLAEARTELQVFKTTHWNAAGGKIQRTHCRAAWSLFMERVDKDLWKLYPERNGGERTWDVATASRLIEEIPALHERIADDGGAELKDRKHMDRVALRFRDVAQKVNETKRRLQATSVTRTPEGHFAAPLEDLHNLLSSGPIAGDEGFIHRLLVRILRGDAIEPAVQDPEELFPPRDLTARPDLLRAFRRRVDDEDLSLGPKELEAPLVAAAVILAESQSPERKAMDGHARVESLLDEPHRFMLRGSGGILARDPEARRRYSEEIERLERLTGQVEATWTDLAAAGVPLKYSVRRAVEDAKERLSGRAPRPLDLHLFAEWLSRVDGVARAAVAQSREALAGESEGRDERTRIAVRQALDEGRLGDAVRILAFEEAAAPDSPRVRDTDWRADAALRFPDPLAALRTPASGTTGTKHLLEKWAQGLQASPHLDKNLRVEFTAALLESVGIEATAGPKVTRVETRALRDWFVVQRLNPSCVPQLSKYQALAIATPRQRTNHGQFVQDTANFAAELQENAPVFPVFLAPRIKADQRRALLSEMTRRKLVAAVVDDLDLCRLLNPAGTSPNPVLGLMEIALEQQQLSAVSPFLLAEGQNVQMEMYFGRRAEAQELALAPRFSRLFSGRKLGKSALLKFVVANYDRRTLPSGKTLRVLYVSAVGVDSESALVQRIGEALRSASNGREATVPAEAGAGDRLDALLKNYSKQRQNESLLIVLDEADVFIEHQIDAYHELRERCLSFRMRSQIEAERDEHGLPTIRFVFAGYRVANTSEGAWANWGEVLRLTPLASEDAADLMARPLGRLGVNCVRQASAIAHRCGYQPAVLLRFGERLLKRLEERSPGASRTTRQCEVSADDVTLTFEDGTVQEEIRTVVRNNFQGNRAGGVVFACLLREFLQFTPGHTIEGAEEFVVERLRDYSGGDLSWFVRETGDASDEVSRNLRDLAERQILVEQRTPGSRALAYMLRFPHHLPVLAPLAEEQWIWSEIAGLRDARKGEASGQVKSALFSPRQMELLAFAASSDAGLGARPVSVVGTHWLEAVLSDSVGLPDRLGFDRDFVISARADGVKRKMTKAARFLVRDASPQDIERIVSEFSGSAPLPLFCGGIDVLRWALEKSDARMPTPRGEPGVLDAPLAMGRMTRGTLAWWFERVRGLNFSSGDAIDVIFQRTAGVPILVREMDLVLVSPSREDWALDLTAESFVQALEKFDSRLPVIARDLADGVEALRLTGRELELLRMMVVIGKGADGSDVLEQLSEEWWNAIHREKCPVPPLNPRDRTSLAVLQQIGLLPVKGAEHADPFSRLAPLQKDDALLRLVPG